MSGDHQIVGNRTNLLLRRVMPSGGCRQRYLLHEKKTAAEMAAVRIGKRDNA